MDHFAEIFISLQKLDNQEDLDADGLSRHAILLPDLHIHTCFTEKKELQMTLAPWTGPDAPGCKRAMGGPDGFSVKFVLISITTATGMLIWPTDVLASLTLLDRLGCQKR